MDDIKHRKYLEQKPLTVRSVGETRNSLTPLILLAGITQGLGLSLSQRGVLTKEVPPQDSFFLLLLLF